MSDVLPRILKSMLGQNFVNDFQRMMLSTTGKYFMAGKEEQLKQFQSQVAHSSLKTLS
jgi:hypothetical protein